MAFASRPALARACAMQCDAVLQVPVRPEGRQPAVGHRADLADRLLLEGRHVDRNVLAQRRHLELELARVEQAAQLRPQALAAPQGAHDPDRLAQAGQRLLVGDAVEVLDHQLAAGAEADDRATLGDLVEGGGAHRQEAGGAAEDVGDAGRDLDALGVQRDLGEQLELLVGPRLGDPDRVVAELVGQLRGADDRLAIVVLPEGDDALFQSHAGLYHSKRGGPERRRTLHCRAAVCSEALWRRRANHPSRIGG